MKNWAIVVFLALIVLSGFVVAQEASQPSQLPNQQALQNISSQIGVKSNEALSREIQIPTGFDTVVKVVFGIKPEQPILFEEGIILVALWSFVLLIMVSLVGFIPLFAGKLMKWAASIVIMLLISITGGFYQGSLFILGLVNMFEFTSKNKMLGMFLVIVIIGVLGWGLTKILGKFKNQAEVGKAERTGLEIGAGLKPKGFRRY